jgi:hypothetical protein
LPDFAVLTPYGELIDRTAATFRLDGALLRAQIMIESSGLPFAWNPEPRYRYLWNVRTQQPFRPLTATERISEAPPADFPFLAGDRDQEWWGQQASWGLMQTMGAVAREYGFAGKYLPELCDPAVGVFYGARYLRRCLNRSHEDYTAGLALYNGGGDAAVAYAHKVFATAGRSV